MGSQDIMIAISELTSSNEARIIADHVINKLKTLRQYENRVKSGLFCTGQEVRFNADAGRLKSKTGIITKVNITKAVVTVDGCSWNIPFSMLEAV